MGTHTPKTKVAGTGKGITDDLATLLTNCRARKSLSLREVGQAVGLSAKALSNIELGRSVPRRTARIRIELFLRQQGCAAKSEAA